MVYFPPTLLGRFVLGTVILLYILLLVLNLVSFGSAAWITYIDVNVRFGLWRVCYGVISASRGCQQWSGGLNIIDTATGDVIFSGKPGFIKAAEGLEITSLILYVLAGLLIIIGIIDLELAPLEYMFGAAAFLLFLCIVFLSASLGVMSVQGRNNHPGAYLDWGWWIGLLGLIVTIIFVVVLIGFILDVALSPNPNESNQFYGGQQQQFGNQFSAPAYPFYNPWPPQNQAQLSPVLELMVQQRFAYPYGQNFINTYM